MASIIRAVQEYRWWDGTTAVPLSAAKVTVSTGGTTRDVQEFRVYLGEDAPPPGVLSASIAAVPNPAPQRGVSVTLTANANGGTAPYSFAFQALTAGITLAGSGNVRTFTIPATGTSWAIRVTVTDSAVPALTAVAQTTVSLQVTTPTLRNFPGLLTKPRVGMSAPANLWSTRVNEVGPGLLARRIFADHTSGGTDQSGLIEDALADGMLPIVSYKGIPSNAQVTAAANYLGSLGEPIAVLSWHEPRNDTALGSTIAAQQTQWLALQHQASPIFKAKSNLSYGPIANGFLVSTANGRTELLGWLPNAELNDPDLWDWIGVDQYQAGPDVLGNTNRPWAGDRIRDWANWLHNTRGHPEYRMLIGEYNGWTGASVADAGEALLSDPTWWCFCVFNSVGGAKGEPLTHDPQYGDRLGAFQGTLNDPRAA